MVILLLYFTLRTVQIVIKSADDESGNRHGMSYNFVVVRSHSAD